MTSKLLYSPQNVEREPLRRVLWEGMYSQSLRDYGRAEAWYRKALELSQEQVDAWCNLGAVLREQGKAEEALEATRHALVLAPQNTAARCNLGILQMDLRDGAGALKTFLDLIQDAPECYLAYFHLGGAYALLNRWDEALAAEQEAIRRNPSFALPYANLGYVLLKLGRLDAAEIACLEALKLEPNLPSANWNLAYVRLLQGRWLDAWPTFHYRHRVQDGLASYRHFEQPSWKGEAFAGKRLLVWAEQGLGDSIQFMRLFPYVKAKGGRVIFQVQEALLPLVENLEGVDQLCGEEENLPEFDLQVPLLSLPACLHMEADRVPDQVPYLRVSGMMPPRLVQMLNESNGMMRIGLAWTGNPYHKEQARRSIPPQAFAYLSPLDHVRWFGLQKTTDPQNPGLPEALHGKELGPLLSDFAVTTWAIQSMDLVITADTVIAHLAGAMGTPTFLLLPFSPDWRWGQSGDTTPWYPTMRLYRQRRHGDWNDVLQRVLADLMNTE